MNNNGENNRGSIQDDDDTSNNNNESTAWGTGLRRRRRNRQNSITSNNEQSSNRNNIRSPNRNNNSYRGSMNGSALPFGGTNHNAHIGSSGGLCGSGGGPGVATQQGHHFENGGHNYKTPIKDGNNNDKEGAAGGLVAATPSSITTAGDTAESTLVSQSPNAALTLHRRRSSSRRLSTINTTQHRQPNSSLQRQYQLLRSQIMLLLGTSSIGLILFLFYALPLAAFISLALMISSMGALLPVIQSIVRARYEMEMQQPGGLTRYLPEYLRVLLTETSLHDFMTDDTFVMEHRYLLLYFMPGLQPEQLMGYINQLPQRHRDALLQPGLGRLMPSIMENFMRVDNIHGNNNGGGQQQLMLGNGDDASSASGLTIGDQHLEEEEEEDNVQENNNEGADQVTLLEAVTGLRRTLQHAGVAINNMGGAAPDEDEHVVVEMSVENNDVHQQTPLLRVANNAPVNNHIQDDDDNSSFDFSIDLDAHGLTDLVNQNGGEEVTPPEPQNNNTPTNVIVEMPQPAVNDDQNQDEIQQQDIDLEGRILYEAANAAARNYASQAADIVGETASDVVVSTSSWFIRAGALTGFVAGMGGMITAAIANQQGIGLNILSITLGTFGGGSVANTSSSSSLSGNTAGGSGSSTGAAAIERRSNGYQSAINGLLATSAVGFVSAGVAYLVRNRVRSNIAAKREEKSQQEEAKEVDSDKA